MRLSTQFSLAFLLLAVLPLGAVTAYSYASSQRVYRGAVEAEVRRTAAEMGSRLEEAAQELSDSIERMRSRSASRTGSAFQKARESALAAAQESELRSLLTVVLSGAGHEPGDLPFALDSGRQLYAAEPDLPRLYSLGLAPAPPGARVVPTDARDWVVVSERDARTGVTVGIARPLDAAVRQIRLTAVRNLGYGLALVLVALLGTLPLSRRLTRQLESLTQGAERLGRGETGVSVPVPGGAHELARLAATFNRMARDLEEQRDRLLRQERLRKELEISRRIQEELLPRRPGSFPCAEVAGLSVPAREVGGDFFNYFALDAERAAVLVGDVSGKGVPAAILMANLQATLRARLPLEEDLVSLLETLDRELGTPEPAASYLTLFVAVLDGRGGCVRYVNAGHNTQLLLRGGGGVERLESSGRPLGLLPGGGFEEKHLPVQGGDTLVLFTDGLVDAESASGEAFGPERLEALLKRDSGGSVAQMLAHVEEALRLHRGATEAGDDATIVAMRARSLPGPSGS